MPVRVGCLGRAVGKACVIRVGASTSSKKLAELRPGEPLRIVERCEIDGVMRARLSEPFDGWVPATSIEETEPWHRHIVNVTVTSNGAAGTRRRVPMVAFSPASSPLPGVSGAAREPDNPMRRIWPCVAVLAPGDPRAGQAERSGSAFSLFREVRRRQGRSWGSVAVARAS